MDISRCHQSPSCSTRPHPHSPPAPSLVSDATTGALRMKLQPPRTTIRKLVIARDKYCCRYCGIQTTIKDQNLLTHRTVDHLIPRSRGGRYDIINLVTACRRCNEYKGDRSLREAGMRLLPVPEHNPEHVHKWRMRHWVVRCINCERFPNSHGRPPYHGGPRACSTGSTFYYPLARLLHEQKKANSLQSAVPQPNDDPR